MIKKISIGDLTETIYELFAQNLVNYEVLHHFSMSNTFQKGLLKATGALLFLGLSPIRMFFSLEIDPKMTNRVTTVLTPNTNYDIEGSS